MESNLVSHAHRELVLLGEEPTTISGYLDIIQAFADMGHSGGSASVAIPTINALLSWKNLTPLTNDPDEWTLVGENMWQSQRNPEAFSYDFGLTHYLLSERQTDPLSIHISQPKADPPLEETPEETIDG